MIKRIYNLLKENGINTDVNIIEAILNGNGTSADGDILDIIETIRNYCQQTDEATAIINELYTLM